MHRNFTKVINRKTGEILFNSAKWCESRVCKFVGYQFRRRLKSDEALILVHQKESIKGTSIHMLFVFTSLMIVWINRKGVATHVQIAQPWRPYYASPVPACYVLETSPENFNLISVGDELDFVD
jgi:uncharacterized membrane protein (UPF0127 family)